MRKKRNLFHLEKKIQNSSMLNCPLQKNMILVDTPGIADKTQEDVAKLMMDYFPNALAVVFVVNVANAGGIQEDRVSYLHYQTN